VTVPTRTCQDHVVTTDLPTLGISPKPITSGSTTQEAKDLGNLQCLGGPSVGLGRTIRKFTADCPKLAPTSSTLRNPNRSYPTRGPCATHGLSPLSSQTIRQTPCIRKQPTQGIEPRRCINKQTTGRTLGGVDHPRLPGGLSARHGQCCSSPKNASQPYLSIHGSPKRLHGLKQDFGEM
jgi:hypothetical protein